MAWMAGVVLLFGCVSWICGEVEYQKHYGELPKEEDADVEQRFWDEAPSIEKPPVKAAL